MPNFEQEWAKALKKSKQFGNSNQSLPQKRQQITEELAYFKKQLINIYQNSTDSNLDLNYYLKAVIKVRAKLLILRLEEEKARIGMIGDAFLKTEYQKYSSECNKLLKVFSN